MTFKFLCPACGKQLGATDTMVGKRKSCPRCRSKFVVPTPEAAAAQLLATPGAAAADSTEHPALLLPARDKKHEDLIDMTAMVDIVFFLLIFFLVTSMQALESVINLPTPQTTAASGTRTASEVAKDPAYLPVTIEEGDRVFIDEEEAIGERDIRAKFREAREKTPTSAASSSPAPRMRRMASSSRSSTRRPTPVCRSCCSQSAKRRSSTIHGTLTPITVAPFLHECVSPPAAE